MMRHRLGLIHRVDPRSDTSCLGVRLRRIIARRPDDFSILLVGLDAAGDLPVGRISRQEIDGRAFDFLPLLRARSEPDMTARREITPCSAFRMALWRHLPLLRREMRVGRRASFELHEFAWAPCARLLGHPVVQVIQSDGGHRRDRVSGLGEHLALRFAARIVGDGESVDRLRLAGGATIAAKTEVIALDETIANDAGDTSRADIEIERLYERHRRLFRITRVASV